MDAAHRRTAETVHGDATNAQRQVCQQADKTRNVEALLTFGKSAAHDDVFDIFRLHAGAIKQAANRVRCQIIGANFRQRAAIGRVEGGADVTRDNDVCHDACLSSFGSFSTRLTFCAE